MFSDVEAVYTMRYGQYKQLKKATTSRFLLRAWVSACLLCISTKLLFAAQTPTEPDLTALSLEELLQQTVVSVSKTEQIFADTAAAVFVISQDDLRRSGVTLLPEALRMVPGLEVARVDASKWAITARGFNGRFANKLLVLVDGRTVYTPTFSGIYWETQDLLLEDVERIEVIRGSGASTWGANAVNGIINVITKKAADTAGGLLTLTSGSEESMIAGIRYGAALDASGHFNIYAKHAEHGSLVDAQGHDANDAWDMTRGGFRVDLTPAINATLLLQGEAYVGDLKQNYMVPTVANLAGAVHEHAAGDASGGSLLVRWEQIPSLASRFVLQGVYDRFLRDDTFQEESRSTYELDLQHDIAISRVQEFSWGLGYRLSEDEIGTAPLVSVTRRQRDLQLLSAFLQDRINFFNDQVAVTVGSKIEHHTFSGWQLQPNIRAIWNVRRNHRFWGSVSRATRTPSRGEIDAGVNFLGLPQLNSLVVLQGNPNFGPEKVVSYELGYRSWPLQDLYFDVSTFYNQYDDLIFARPLAAVIEPGQPVIVPLLAINGERAATSGIEVAADWRPDTWLRLQWAYTYLHTHFKRKSAQDNVSFFPTGDRRAPMQQTSLRAAFNLNHGVELDVTTRYVDGIPDLTVINYENLPHVKSYVALDVTVGWQLQRHVSLSLVGRNLNDAQHLESLQEIGTYPTQVQRSVRGQVKWQF